MDGIIDGLPAAYYTDAAIYQAERRLIFANNWLYAAHVDELREAGSFLACEIAGLPLLLIKQQDATISCFQNICRHRGAPLVSAAEGVLPSGTITCKYHGWSYGCTGKLTAVPHLDCLSSCTQEQLSLIPVRTGVYRGLIFVNLATDDGNQTAFEDSFAELIKTIDESDCQLEEYAFHSKMVRSGKFNWKVWVEGYQECYHCPTIHPVFNKDFQLPKYRVENRERFSLHSCERKVPSSSGRFNGLWLWIYPNLGMPVYEPCFYTLQVNPLSVNETTLTYTFHARRGADPSILNDFRSFVDQITGEDIAICEAVQRNLASGLCEQTRLNEKRENGVAYFHSLVRRQLGTAVSSPQTPLCASANL
ncbi:MAG TPA: aromatic ring-hydroxylating dioxygenase subunit alpha [Candidatus Obscuribacterales bacterium]